MDCIYKIRVNRPCKLYIDGEELMCLDEQKLTKIILEEGEYLRKVVAIDDETIFSESIVFLSHSSKLDNINLNIQSLEKARASVLPVQKIKIDNLYFIRSSKASTLMVTSPADSKAIYSYKTISIPSHVYYKGYLIEVSEIDNSTFCNCSSIVSITIPQTIVSIGYRAFFGCSSLLQVILPDSVSSIGFKAFANCSQLSFISFGFGVSRIERGLLEGCFNLKSVAITESIKYIAPNTISPANIQLNITSIENICNGFLGQLLYDSHIGNEGNELFINGQEITQLAIPQSVTRIEECAFYGFSNLKTITIPESVVYIGCSAFSNCFSLKYIVIPSSVKHIDHSAFYNLDLSAIILLTRLMPECGHNLFAWRFPAPVLFAHEEILNCINDIYGWNECDKKLPIRFKSNNFLYEVTSHETVSMIIEDHEEIIVNDIIPDEVTYNNTRFIVTSIKKL